MRLFGEAVEAREPSGKRALEEDDEVYAARKQQLLKKIAQETACTDMTIVKEHAQGSMGVLDNLSSGNAPPTTLQLLQTIRHNLTQRIGSMVDSSMLAIKGPTTAEAWHPDFWGVSLSPSPAALARLRPNLSSDLARDGI